jgi:hypothetical protein
MFYIFRVTFDKKKQEDFFIVLDILIHNKNFILELFEIDDNEKYSWPNQSY